MQNFNYGEATCIGYLPKDHNRFNDNGIIFKKVPIKGKENEDGKISYPSEELYLEEKRQKKESPKSDIIDMDLNDIRFDINTSNNLPAITFQNALKNNFTQEEITKYIKDIEVTSEKEEIFNLTDVYKLQFHENFSKRIQKACELSPKQLVNFLVQFGNSYSHQSIEHVNLLLKDFLKIREKSGEKMTISLESVITCMNRIEEIIKFSKATKYYLCKLFALYGEDKKHHIHKVSLQYTACKNYEAIVKEANYGEYYASYIVKNGIILDSEREVQSDILWLNNIDIFVKDIDIDKILERIENGERPTLVLREYREQYQVAV